MDYNSKELCALFTRNRHDFMIMSEGSTDANVICLRAFCLYDGNGATKDVDQALQLVSSVIDEIKHLAEYGDTEAQTSLSRMYLHGLNIEENHILAEKWCRRAAELGFARAQNNLGVMYETGCGIEKDDVLAVEWYRKAAEQGYAMAQCNLGVMYENGRGVDKDEKIAVEWYRKAAEQGDAWAQFHLGWMYKNGYGVEKDDRVADGWCCKAAEQGYAPAQGRLGWMYEFGRGVEKDDSVAVEWYCKAAEQGHARAQFHLGVMYANGRGVEKDDALAVEWCRKAAEQGYAPAQGNLGRMYANGRGAEKDDGLAVKWYRKAAEQGYAEAQFNLGEMYADGRGVEKDDILAVEWYRKAAKQGNAAAQYKLGRMYENGRGVDRDEALAVEWYRKAAEQGDEQSLNDLNRIRICTEGLSALRRFIPSGTMYHITSIRNLENILNHGILAKHLVERRGMEFDDISDMLIQRNLREGKIVFDGNTLHDYAPFYINPRNAMLYRVCKERRESSIVILEVAMDILLHTHFAFSNMNAAVSSDNGQVFVRNVDELRSFDWQRIYANSWISFDENEAALRDRDVVRKMQAEVLVLNGVSSKFIRCVHCPNKSVQEKVIATLRQVGVLGVQVRISPSKFFG